MAFNVALLILRIEQDQELHRHTYSLAVNSSGSSVHMRAQLNIDCY